MDKKNKSIKIKKPFSKKKNNKPKKDDSLKKNLNKDQMIPNTQADNPAKDEPSKSIRDIVTAVPKTTEESVSNAKTEQTTKQEPDKIESEQSELNASAKTKSKTEKKQKKKKNKRKRRKIALGVVSAVVIIGILVVGNLGTILVWLGFTDMGNFGDSLSDTKKYQKLSIKSTLYENLNPNITFTNENVINVLFFGLDENVQRQEKYSIFRPDTIMLISINLETEDIQIISIPRDSRVDIHFRSGRDKINSSFYYGSLESPSEEENFQWGVDCLVGTVSDLLGGIPINYWVGIDMDGVPNIIDTIGGVDFYMEDDFDFEGTHIDQGDVTLDGIQFLQLARCRSYAGGDITRVSVQQELLVALFEELTEAGNIMKLPKAISQTFDILTTNLTFNQITTLGFTVKDYDLSNINTATMPGDYGNLYGVSYWIINQYERVDFVYEHFGITTSRLSQDPKYIPKATPDEDTENTEDTGDTTNTGDTTE